MNTVARLLPTLLLLMAIPAHALTFVKVADSGLLARAELIVAGRVLDVDPSPGIGWPVTDYLVEIEDVVVGELLFSPIVVRSPGGELLDGTGLHLTGVPRMSAGDRVLLFLLVGDDSTFRVLQVNQGLFRLETVDEVEIAIRSFSESVEVGFDLKRVDSSEKPRDMALFRAWLVEGGGSAANYFIELSEEARASVLHKYNLIANPPIRYTNFDSGGNVRWFAHQDGQAGLSSGGFSEFQTAINMWNADSATPIRYIYGGTTTATGGLQDYDGINAIAFGDIRGMDNGVFRCGSGGTVALGGPWFSGSHTHNGESFRTAIGGDIQTNQGIDCLVGGVPFIARNKTAEEVFAHELGHTLGMGHSCGDDGDSCTTSLENDALMRATVHSDNRGARLNADDRAGIRFLYGAPVTIPAAPSDLTVAAVSSQRIDLFWRDNSGDETSFDVERRTGAGTYQNITSRGANSTSYQDIGVLSGTTYTYRVRARNTAGASAYTNTATTSTVGEQAPTELVAAGLSNSQIRLTWHENATSEAGFQVEGKTGGGSFVTLQTTPANTTLVDVGGLNQATLYTFRVKAIGGAGDSSYSNESSATTFFSDPEPCVPSLETLCLNGGRFEVEVDWRDFSGGVGVGTDAGLVSPDSGLFWFFTDTNWELLVKVLDGCGITDRFWVFAAATTNVEYTLHVTDTVTGFSKSYPNGLGVASPAVTDTDAFATCSAVIPDGWEAPAPKVVEPEIGAPFKAASCEPGEGTLCLNRDRFEVEIAWRDFSDNVGSGRVDDYRSLDSGLMYFFSPANLEVLVKVLDGCGINNRVWVFAAATTNVEYTLRVTDTDSGLVKEYFNPLGTSASAITDTDAFSSCN